MEENKVVETLHEQSLNELETLREENNEENKKVVDDAKKKIDEILEELKVWAKDNVDPEKIEAAVNKAKTEVVDVLKTTKEKAIEVSESEQFRSTLNAGKDFLIGAGTLLADGIKTSADVLMKNEHIKKVVNEVDGKLDVLRESETLKNVVDSAEEVTGKVTEAIFGGMKKFFEKETKQTPPEIPTEEKGEE